MLTLFSPKTSQNIKLLDHYSCFLTFRAYMFTIVTRFGTTLDPIRNSSRGVHREGVFQNGTLVCFLPMSCGIHSIVTESMEFFLNVFHWIQRIQWQKKNYDIKRTRTCHPATSCVRDQHATTVPARHMWEIGSLNWAQFMLQWFISFSEFTEFSESSAPFRKNSNIP